MVAPRFTTDQLNAAKHFYQDEGFAIVDDVFCEQQIRSVRHVWGAILARRGTAKEHKFRSLLLPHTHYPAILDFISDKSFLESVRTFLGNDIQLLQSQLMFGSPGNPGFTPHQDNFTNRVQPADAAVAAWIAIEDVSPENGALKVWRGSHQRGLYKVRLDWRYLLKRSPDIVKSSLRAIWPRRFGVENDSGVMERYGSCIVTDTLEELILPVDSGSVVFLHGDLVHASLPNSSTNRCRYSLLTNFIRRGAKYRSGILTGRKPLDLPE